jgi:pimeloyl-ACP methyl ester carboxylesterase
LSALLLIALFGAAPPASAQAAGPQAQPVYGAMLEGFDYPFPVQRFEFASQNQPLSMAFLDVAAAQPNGRTVVLLHGKNFCAATWGETIQRLTAAGYRVIAPDQIGFCKSSKPQAYQFTFEQLAANTRALLASRGVTRAVILGHSMGGMIAARYALTYPAEVEKLVMVNPLGLEDWRAEGAPPVTLDQAFQGELKTSAGSIKAYQLKYYYGGKWLPRYDPWVSMIAGMYAGPGKRALAWDQALTSEMIYTQPVVHEFPRIRVPTLLLIGGRDRTAPGAARAAPEVQARLGDYPTLARRAAAAIPDATLVLFPELGHAPQMEAPEEFYAALLRGLAQP